MLQMPSGRSGGGGTVNKTEGAAPRRSSDAITYQAYTDKLDEFLKNGDDMGMHKYQMSVQAGEVIVTGVNDEE